MNYYSAKDFCEINLKMDTEEHYKKQADCYHQSDQYQKMRNLYPILQSSIKDCKGEQLVA